MEPPNDFDPDPYMPRCSLCGRYHYGGCGIEPPINSPLIVGGVNRCGAPTTTGPCLRRTAPGARCVHHRDRPPFNRDDSPPTCLTCVHSGKTLLDDGEPLMECHRYPPQLFHSEEDGAVRQAYPTIREDDWCGEYRDA